MRDDLALFLPATLELVLAGFTLALAIGIPGGILASAHTVGMFDRASNLLAVLGASAPVFALASLVQQLFFNLHLLEMNHLQGPSTLLLRHGEVAIGGNLRVDGQVTVPGNLEVAGQVTIPGSMRVDGQATLSGPRAGTE